MQTTSQSPFFAHQAYNAQPQKPSDWQHCAAGPGGMSNHQMQSSHQFAQSHQYTNRMGTGSISNMGGLGGFGAMGGGGMNGATPAGSGMTTNVAAMAAVSRAGDREGGAQPSSMLGAQAGGESSQGIGIGGGGGAESHRILSSISAILSPPTRETALLELSKKREQVPELALILWHSFGVMTSLLQEIITVYPLLNPSQLTAAASNRVCNALALLQCVASHAETRGLFLGAHIPLFLYPFLNTTSKSRPFEYLRLTSLGVIGALVKNDTADSRPTNNPQNPQAGPASPIHFLLTTEIIPLCLRIMETGSELSKTVAIFVVQKILLDDQGLQYICATYERFYAVGTVLSNMVGSLAVRAGGGAGGSVGGGERGGVRLLKHVVRCFLRLSDNARAREALRQCLPEPLRDATFSPVLRDDAATKRCLAQLLLALSDQAEPSLQPSYTAGHQVLLAA